MKALLISENKDDWEYFQKVFASHYKKIELLCVIDGDSALEYLSFEGPFGMFIVDAALKSAHPSELARKLISIGGSRPLIFFGSQGLIKSQVDQDIYTEHEHNHIFAKPIQLDHFKVAVTGILEWAKEEEFEKSVEEMANDDLLPLKIRNFYLFDTIGYDVFVELTANKYIKIISANKKYQHNDIYVYARKGIKQLYLRKDEYLKFLEDGIKKVSLVLKVPQRIKQSVVIVFQIRAALLIHQYVRTVGVSPQIVELCELVISAAKYIITENKTFRGVANLFPTSEADLAEQAILTLYLCESMLETLGWSSDTSRSKLGLSSLLYDSMLEEDELFKVKNLTDPLLEKFSEHEQEEYRLHPTKAAEIAKQFQGYSEVDFIVAQHHEMPNCEGFPNRLSHNKLTAHSCMFIVATKFARGLALYPRTADNIYAVFKEIESLYKVGNFKDAVKALQKSIS